MNSYKELYFYLFNALTDALEELEYGHPIKAILLMKQAQQQAEEQHLAVDILPEIDQETSSQP